MWESCSFFRFVGDRKGSGERERTWGGSQKWVVKVVTVGWWGIGRRETVLQLLVVAPVATDGKLWWWPALREATCSTCYVIGRPSKRGRNLFLIPVPGLRTFRLLHYEIPISFLPPYFGSLFSALYCLSCRPQYRCSEMTNYSVHTANNALAGL